MEWADDSRDLKPIESVWTTLKKHSVKAEEKEEDSTDKDMLISMFKRVWSKRNKIKKVSNNTQLMQTQKSWCSQIGQGCLY